MDVSVLTESKVLGPAEIRRGPERRRGRTSRGDWAGPAASKEEECVALPKLSGENVSRKGAMVPSAAC